MLKFNYYYTITAGRTGTAWLSHFIFENLNIESIHEPIGIYDFGNEMPDIKIMRAFNNFGNCEIVKKFWRNKLLALSLKKNFAETNHTLSKCGLIENIHNTKLASKTLFLILRRNKINQCISYINRGDFHTNITIPWQWYLLPNYNKKIIQPDLFLGLKKFRAVFWYIFEMEARQLYYLKKFKNRLNFLEITLEEINDNDGAQKFLSSVGIKINKPKLPPKTNQSLYVENNNLINEVRTIYNSIEIDIEEIVINFINSGKSLH